MRIYNIENYSSDYYSLIDRLKRHSEWKYPNRVVKNYKIIEISTIL